MSIRVRIFTPIYANDWDEFCKNSLQATLLHTRRFLSYHGDRFEDQSLIIEDDGKLVGLFPAGLSQDDVSCVVSHPGITFGGILHQGGISGNRMINTLEAIRRQYVSQGFTKLIYKAVPTFYHQAPSQDDLYALFRLGAKRTRCDLSSTIDLDHRLPVSTRRRRNLKRSIKKGVKIVKGLQYLADFWGILADNLARKHGLPPVHNLEEITLLAKRFPDNILCICCTLNEIVIAGTLLFTAPTTIHSQYIASTETGYAVSGLDAIFEYCIDIAKQDGKRWFDFGISTDNNCLFLNDGLYQFKSEFGSGGTVHEFFELNLLESSYAD